MLTLPARLRGLYRYERDGKVVLGNLESGMILRASPLLQEFLVVCERLSTEEVKRHLQSRHPSAIVDHFLRRVELYAPHLFADGPGHVAGRTFSLSQWKAREPHAFTTMTLNLIHSCNLRCDYCFKSIEFRRDTKSMPSHTAVKAADLFIDQLTGHGQIIFTGGEPLLCFETIADVVRAVQRLEAPVSFLIKTNATLLTTETRRYLAGAGFTFQVSVDGPQAVHNRHRKDANCRGSFDLTMQGLRGLLADVPRERVRLHGTVTHETVHGIGESLGFLHSLGARSATIKPVMDNASAMALDPDDQEIYAREVFRQAQLNVMRGQSPGQDGDPQTDGICGIGLWHIAVDVDGSVYPCYRLSGIEAYRMGHVDRGLTGEVPAELMELYDWEEPGQCGTCTRRILCSRGCYAERLLVPRESPCDSLERIVGERIVSLNFQSDDVVAMLPVL